MKSLHILCVDDEPEVLEAVERDIASLEDHFPIETAESADDARERIKSIEAAGGEVALIFCDHVMPGDNGVDLLVEMQTSDSTRRTRKVLLTGQAGLDATVNAVNKAQLDHYIAKPWSPTQLLEVAKAQLTAYVIEQSIDPRPYLSILDTAKLAEQIHKHGLIVDE